MLQRLSQSRFAIALLSALAAATVAGGVSSAVAVTQAKAEADEITMCVSALGTKIRFVHVEADCNAGELVRTWNIEGPKGDRGLRGNTGPAGPSGPTGPAGAAGAAGTSTSTYTGGFGVDTAQSVAFFVPTGTTATPVVIATAAALTPTGTHPYFLMASAPGGTPPLASAACTGGTAASNPSYQIVLNGTNIVSTSTWSSFLLAGEMRTFSGGSNSLTMQVTPGVCSSTLTNTTAHLADVTSRRLTMIYGG